MAVWRGRAVAAAVGFFLGAGFTLLVVFLVSDGGYQPQSSPSLSPSASPDNISLYSSASQVARSLYAGNYDELSGWVSAQSGLLFVPFSTVETDRNLCFTPYEVKGFEDNKTVYLWGVEPGTGKRLESTPSQYISENLRILDYSAAPLVGICRVIRRGNAPENVAEAFPDGLYVDFYYPPAEQGGIDWSSLKVVFVNEEGRLRLVALIRSVYTEQ